jgi:hypothetical protein
MHMNSIRSGLTAGLLTASTLLGCLLSATRVDSQRWKPDIPRTWDDAALADWATPVAGLNVRPTHISAREYYSLTTENLRTYPVYFPGREPNGYWDMLQHVGPKPLIEPDTLTTETDWIEAGHRVFDEADDLHLRTFDPKFIAAARNREALEQTLARPLPDGTLFGARWVPTARGVALTFSNCSFCHVLYLPDGRRVAGAPFKTTAPRPPDRFPAMPLISQVQTSKRVVTGATPFFMGPEPVGMWLYRAYGVPWNPDDVHERLKAFTQDEYDELDTASRSSGGIARWNGSLYFPAKVPDLIGIKDRKYIDHTATHLHRGVGDLMRYAALVSFADTADFGSHHMLSTNTRRVQARLPDEALYALALYIYSLQPPPNPNPVDAKAQAGETLFRREGCPRCHTPPLYTSNKLTIAKGFDPPSDVPSTLDILRISVGTDSGLALSTRKGTGYYKVPSLKGVWYRGHYLHDGTVASLEEMFDPDRLKETHVPGGWRPLRSQTHAIQGHEFGLHLAPAERDQLIAFLRTL